MFTLKGFFRFDKIKNKHFKQYSWNQTKITIVSSVCDLLPQKKCILP